MRRWAGRIAAGIGVALLVLLWVLAGAAYITARPADPMLWPPRADAGRIEVVLVSNGYHTGLALPRAALAEFASGRGYPALIAVTQRFAAFEWIEFGWGDREFYRSVPTVARPAAPARAARAVLARKYVGAACRRPRRRSGARVHRRRARAHPALAQRLRPDAGSSSMRPSFRRKRARCPISAAGSTARACSIRRTARSASSRSAITGSPTCSAPPDCRTRRCSRPCRPG